MQMSACLKEHMRGVINYVFCAPCMVCWSIAVCLNRQDPQAKGAKHLVSWNWSVIK